MLSLAPAVLATTSTFQVHVAPGAKVTLSIGRKLAPALTSPMLPPQLLTSPVGVATTSPLGRLSAKPMLVSVEPGFGVTDRERQRCRLSDQMPAGPNALVSIGGAGTGTCERCRCAAAPAPLWVGADVPGRCCPWLPALMVAVTLTLQVHEAPRCQTSRCPWR